MDIKLVGVPTGVGVTLGTPRDAVAFVFSPLDTGFRPFKRLVVLSIPLPYLLFYFVLLSNTKAFMNHFFNGKFNNFV